MKLVIVVDKNDHKLTPKAYSQTYYDMFKALIDRFDAQKNSPKTMVFFDDCSADDIEADVILFYDVHSSHRIKIEGIEKHPALKVEYLNDPHQKDFDGKYKDGTICHKLGAERRIKRARERGVQYFICPYRKGYYDQLASFIGDDAEKMLLWYPVCPSKKRFEGNTCRLKIRESEILGNGATWSGDLPCYDFRRWAFNRIQVRIMDHVIRTGVPMDYTFLLMMHAGGLALCDWYPVPKYFEMPLAGMVTFVQWHEEMEDLGFKDGENCICVDRDNFDVLTMDFLSDIENYQELADKGRELIEAKYTAEKFASWFFDSMKALL